MAGERATIANNDLLVVDRSRKPKTGDVVIACLDGGFTVKRLRCAHGEVWLVPENKTFGEIKIEADQDFVIWGVVTARITQF